MAKIKAIQYSKVFSLGNYENEKIGVTADVLDGENPNDVLEKCKLAVEMNSSEHTQQIEQLENIVEFPEQHRYADVEKAKRKLEKFQKAKSDAVTETNEELNKLIHHKDTTVGLYATDINPIDFYSKYRDEFPGKVLHTHEDIETFLNWLNEKLFHKIEYV